MVKSKQERFASTDEAGDYSDVFWSLMKFYEDLEEKVPAYQSDSRNRDKFLYDYAFKEPHLAGVLNSVTAIDKNRGWRVVGGKTQVNRTTEMLHNFEVAPGLIGWRPALAAASSSFWSTNMGSIVELGTEGKNGPVRALYHVDPTRCYLTGNYKTPLRYSPSKGKVQNWKDTDFFRVASLPSIREDYRGLGNCAIDRALQLGQLMRAVYRHDEERLGARAPRGLMLLSGINRKQWDDAMEARDAELDQNMMQYFGSVAVLASASASVDAKMIALSELPTSFNLKEGTDMILYGYALCFGYDASEFYPVQYGALGRGNEVALQHEKATGKGRLDFVLGFQEQLQNFLPDSVTFTFDQRDEEGDLLHAKVEQAWVDVAKTMYTATVNGQPMITVEEARVLLADYGIIPSSWSEAEYVHGTDLEDVDEQPEVESPDSSSEGQSPEPSEEPSEDNPVAASPTANAKIQYMKYKTLKNKVMREKLLEDPAMWKAAEKYPREPIVQYSFPANTITILWESGEDLLKPRVWGGMK